MTTHFYEWNNGFRAIPLTVPSRVFIPFIPFKTLIPTPENPYPWSRVGVFRGKGQGSHGMTPGLPLTILINLKIGDAVTTMAANRPDDLDPEGWYETAVRIDQNRAMNAAFWDSIAAHLLYHEPTASEDEPKISDVVLSSDKEPDVLNIKGMSADDIRHLLQQLSQAGKLPIPPTGAKTPAPPKTPLAPRTNRFQELVVEKTSESTSDLPATLEATCGRQPKRPQWERRHPRQPKISAMELGPNSLHLQVEVESTDTQWRRRVGKFFLEHVTESSSCLK